jgi:hypothetical protein
MRRGRGRGIVEVLGRDGGGVGKEVVGERK